MELKADMGRESGRRNRRARDFILMPENSKVQHLFKLNFRSSLHLVRGRDPEIWAHSRSGASSQPDAFGPKGEKMNQNREQRTDRGRNMEGCEQVGEGTWRWMWKSGSMRIV